MTMRVASRQLNFSVRRRWKSGQTSEDRRHRPLNWHLQRMGPAGRHTYAGYELRMRRLSRTGRDLEGET